MNQCQNPYKATFQLESKRTSIECLESSTRINNVGKTHINPNVTTFVGGINHYKPFPVMLVVVMALY